MNKRNTLPDTLNLDENGYPSDERLKQISETPAIEDGARWMVDVFPSLANSMSPFGVCEVVDECNSFDEPVKRIEFYTQGWSGCEDFIGAVLANTMLRMMYYEAWRRGGHHTFVVTQNAYEESCSHRSEKRDG